LQFSGTDFHFPITKLQVQVYQQANPDRTFYLGFDDKLEPYAFGEIIPQAGNVPRLGRILVGQKDKRGIGLGQLFVLDLIQECVNCYKCNAVELFVWDQNLAAIRCYLKVGFKYIPEKQMTMTHEGRQYDIHKMISEINEF
jgi:RimJ/RimL family protein N-acetyltransferase